MSGIRSLPSDLEPQVVASVSEACRACAADGAHAVVLSGTHCAALLPPSDVPVVDCTLAGLSAVEALVRTSQPRVLVLRRTRCGPSCSSHGACFLWCKPKSDVGRGQPRTQPTEPSGAQHEKHIVLRRGSSDMSKRSASRPVCVGGRMMRTLMAPAPSRPSEEEMHPFRPTLPLPSWAHSRHMHRAPLRTPQARSISLAATAHRVAGGAAARRPAAPCGGDLARQLPGGRATGMA